MAQVAVMAALFVAGAYKGRQAQKAKDREAAAYLDARNRRMAAMTRDVAEEARKKEMMRGRALAVTAASGGGVDTATVVNLIGDLNAEGEYRIMAAMYAGQDEAAGLSFRAEAAEREGEAAFTAGIIDGATSALSFYAGTGGSFGGKTPPPTSGIGVKAPGGGMMSPVPGYTGARPGLVTTGPGGKVSWPGSSGP